MKYTLFCYSNMAIDRNRLMHVSMNFMYKTFLNMLIKFKRSRYGVPYPRLDSWMNEWDWYYSHFCLTFATGNHSVIQSAVWQNYTKQQALNSIQ